MILADTSVWIAHLRGVEPHLQDLLDAGEVLMHVMVLGEIACGGVRNREKVLRDLNDLPAITECKHADVLSMIEQKALMRRGMGFVDAHLLCSVLGCHNTALWTRDAKLGRIADDLGVAYSVSS